MNSFIDGLQKVYCRLGVSKIHGVGVFAIRPIPLGINPMEEMTPCEFDEVPLKDLEALNLPSEMCRYIKDMCPENGGVYDVPSQGLNSIGVAWYLNHSDTPNMEEKDGNFFSLRKIFPGEELTVNYGTYGALNL